MMQGFRRQLRGLSGLGDATGRTLEETFALDQQAGAGADAGPPGAGTLGPSEETFAFDRDTERKHFQEAQSGEEADLQRDERHRKAQVQRDREAADRARTALTPGERRSARGRERSRNEEAPGADSQGNVRHAMLPGLRTRHADVPPPTSDQRAVDEATERQHAADERRLAEEAVRSAAREAKLQAKRERERHRAGAEDQSGSARAEGGGGEGEDTPWAHMTQEQKDAYQAGASGRASAGQTVLNELATQAGLPTDTQHPGDTLGPDTAYRGRVKSGGSGGWKHATADAPPGVDGQGLPVTATGGGPATQEDGGDPAGSSGTLVAVLGLLGVGLGGLYLLRRARRNAERALRGGR